jgi:hypothetical protein
MIGDVLVFLKNSLNAYFGIGASPPTSAEDQVVFLSGQKLDPLTFALGKVSVLLINIEEENTLRKPDPYLRIDSNGTHQRVNPDIRLNLFVLFVVHYNDYEDSLRSLSRVITYFQKHRVFTHQSAPDLPQNVEKLVIELVTLPFAQQNEVWNSLRVTYHLSVLYKIKMVIFTDDQPTTSPEITEVNVQTS